MALIDDTKELLVELTLRREHSHIREVDKEEYERIRKAYFDARNDNSEDMLTIGALLPKLEQMLGISNNQVRRLYSILEELNKLITEAHHLPAIHGLTVVRQNLLKLIEQIEVNGK